MPQFNKVEVFAAFRVWKGHCPAYGCTEAFTIEASPWQPRGDVLKAFKIIRPRGKHVHGNFFVYEHRERGGEQ